MTNYRFKLLIPAGIIMIMIFAFLLLLSQGGKTDTLGWIVIACFVAFILLVVYFVGLAIDAANRK